MLYALGLADAENGVVCGDEKAVNSSSGAAVAASEKIGRASNWPTLFETMNRGIFRLCFLTAVMNCAAR